MIDKPLALFRLLMHCLDLLLALMSLLLEDLIEHFSLLHNLTAVYVFCNSMWGLVKRFDSFSVFKWLCRAFLVLLKVLFCDLRRPILASDPSLKSIVFRFDSTEILRRQRCDCVPIFRLESVTWCLGVLLAKHVLASTCKIK